MKCIRKLALACIAAGALHAPVARAATDYSDIWWNPAESGWGVNLAQNGSTIFATFFIYASDGTPTWYVSALVSDGNGHFTGKLAAAKGTFFGIPWVAGDASGTLVGTATFTPSAGNAWQGTLAYVVDGAGAATRAIERQTLAPIALAGLYAGGQSGAYSGCSSSGNNFAYVDRYDVTVTQPTAGNATFQFAYTRGVTCTLSGPLEQHGQQFNMTNAAYACSNGLKTNATVSEIKRTAAGIEGRFVAPSVGGGCKETANFAAAL